jgi:hypothetical protein
VLYLSESACSGTYRPKCEMAEQWAELCWPVPALSGLVYEGLAGRCLARPSRAARRAGERPRWVPRPGGESARAGLLYAG